MPDLYRFSRKRCKTITNSNSVLLGVNIDHVATLRQARGTIYPDPLEAALLAEEAGADYITLHLREDRRHIQDADVERMQQQLKTHINLEIAITEEMLDISSRIKPVECCLVPEKREELTTEGGLDVFGQASLVKDACQRLSASGIRVSLFIDTDFKQIEAAKEVGAPVIEIHTGHYADAPKDRMKDELLKVSKAVEYGNKLGLHVNVGHGLNCDNVSDIIAIKGISELNIGHSIISRALFVGIKQAVIEIKDLL